MPDKSGSDRTVEQAVTRMGRSGLWAAAGIAAAALLASGPASAAEGEAHNWQVSLQNADSPVMEMIHSFSFGLMIVVSLIVLLVLCLLAWIIVRYNAKSNPVAAKTSHNTLIEVIWTVGPVLILVGIAVPSFSLLFAQYDPARAIAGYDPQKDPPLTIKAIGHRWAWGYVYPDYMSGDIEIGSRMLSDAERTDPANQPRLLAVDNMLVVPVNTVIDLQVISTDVIHSFAVPSFGVKIDAVPGRLNGSWFLAEREGVYYGQCSELCGQGHAFMPIGVRVVSTEAFAAFAAALKANPDSPANAYGALTAAMEQDQPVQTAAR
jgi:cytochrome c oxidase subunit 2